MTTKMKAILLLATFGLAASTAGVFATQQPRADDALPCAEGVEVPQIVVSAKRDVAE
jgi:hypothetical protein